MTRVVGLFISAMLTIAFPLVGVVLYITGGVGGHFVTNTAMGWCLIISLICNGILFVEHIRNQAIHTGEILVAEGEDGSKRLTLSLELEPEELVTQSRVMFSVQKPDSQK